MLNFLSVACSALFPQGFSNIYPNTINTLSTFLTISFYITAFYTLLKIQISLKKQSCINWKLPGWILLFFFTLPYNIFVGNLNALKCTRSHGKCIPKISAAKIRWSSCTIQNTVWDNIWIEFPNKWIATLARRISYHDVLENFLWLDVKNSPYSTPTTTPKNTKEGVDLLSDPESYKCF